MEMNLLRSSPSSINLSTAFPTSPSLQVHGPRVSPLFTNEFRKVSLCAKPLPKRNCVQASIVQLEPSLKNKAVDLASELKGTSIFLVGMNGSMKTSLGKLLADALRYYYFDSDSLVVQAAGGESAAKSLKEEDEEGFQSSETEVLKQLSSMGRLVICAGDGAVQSSTNLAYLRYGISVWIDVPLDILAKEAMERGEYSPFTWPISASDTFPEVFEKLSKLYAELEDGYATADARVTLQNVASAMGYDDVEAVTTEDMAMEILKEMEKLTRVKKMMEAAARPF
ncbi:probable inactive shikimate kinase like 1, chloroplastic isoform X2 [Aristolochia californica]|uniref:probable inactive shikimate kinase like 1, chloroplastic isoform X2 n=1 Tax=Aristolochia californica TaxID=171875 RepID=UPI0035DC0FA5